MGNIIDYVSKHGSFVLFDPPMIEHRVKIETPYNSFNFSYVPDRFLKRAHSLVAAWRYDVGRIITWPTIRKHLFFLPWKNNPAFIEYTNRMAKTAAKLSAQVVSEWDASVGEAQDALADYMRITWQRSPIHDECTLGEYTEIGLKAIKASQAGGPKIRPLRYTYFSFAQTSHTEPQVSTYVGVSAMLWRWFQNIAESVGAHALRKLRRYAGLLPMYESASVIDWQRHASKHTLVRDRFDGYLPSLSFIGRYDAVDVLEDLANDVVEFYADVRHKSIVKQRLEGRDRFVQICRKAKRAIKPFQTAMSEHVDLHKLVENE